MDKLKTTPKDFFLYFASFVTLYVSAISLVNLLWNIVNKVFPDNLNDGYYYDYYSAGMRLSIASLIVVFPIYLFLASYLNKYLLATPEKRDLAVRKWLTYLTLFVTGAAVVSDFAVGPGMERPIAVAVGPTGHLFVADFHSGKIIRIGPKT